MRTDEKALQYRFSKLYLQWLAVPSKLLVGTGRFELPTPRTPSECSTRLSHVPTRKDSTEQRSQRKTVSLRRRGSHRNSTPRQRIIGRLSSSVKQGSVPLSGAMQRSFGRQKRVPEDDTGPGRFDLLLQISPVRANAHFHLKRHGQPMHFFHMLPHERLHNFHFILGNFEHQFVVHLQRHS